jgi:ATP-binding cassette subfamily B protein
MGIQGGKHQYQAEKATSRYERRSGYLADVLAGREAACERTLFGFTPFVNGMWREAFLAAFAVRLKERWRWYVRSYAGNAVATLCWVSLMVILLGPVRSGAVTVGLFLAVTQSLLDLDIVWGFMQTVNGIARDSEFFRDLTTFVSLDEAARVRAVHHPGSSTVLECLELSDVRFRYPGAGHDVLDGVSCTFRPGGHYAIVGANGAGKTTVTRLITGLYPVQKGDIRLNGRPIGDYSPEEIRSHFAIVYQDFARYDLTLRENITFGRRPDGESEDRFWTRLLHLVGLEETVARLPRGLDTPLGKLKEDGMDLSGGEWQRIAMARALAMPGDVLILDEPTASLDPLAESRLYELFARISERKTTLFISHRLGATKLADEILVLSGGRICESGNHAALMEADGLYRRMYESQRRWYEN